VAERGMAVANARIGPSLVGTLLDGGLRNEKKGKKAKKRGQIYISEINLRIIWPTSPPNGCGEGKLFKAR
jgi:hypothetical protein